MLDSMSKTKQHRLIRAVEPTELKLAAGERSIEFAFSSELPVERWFGSEILSHNSGAADFARLNGGAQLLFNHDMDRYIGVIERAWMAEDKRAYVRARFSQNEDAQQIMKDVEDGILKNVSFGYQIEEMVMTKKNENEPDEYTATRWTPYEVSFVTVPADPTVGVGRSIEKDEVMVAMVTRAAAEFIN